MDVTNTICEWDGCDKEQFDDWFYCYNHSRAINVMNRYMGSFLNT